MKFWTMSRPSEWAYGHPERKNHYQNQTGPTPSRQRSASPIRVLGEFHQDQLPGVDWSQYETHGR